jgi:hypothetical protein
MITGFKNSGKSTVAKIFKKYGYINISFGSHLKDVISVMFCLPRDLLEGDTIESREWRETEIKELNYLVGNGVFKNDKYITPRLLMQRIGTDLIRKNICDDFWLRKIINYKQNLKEYKGIVVSDCRFLNELEIADITINIQRYNYSLQEIKNMHLSETEHLNFKHNYYIQNKSSYKDLEIQIYNIISQLEQL